VETVGNATVCVCVPTMQAKHYVIDKSVKQRFRSRSAEEDAPSRVQVIL